MKSVDIATPGGPEVKVSNSSRPAPAASAGTGPWLSFREISTEAQGLPWLHWPLPLNQRNRQDRLSILRSAPLLKPRTYEVDAATTRKLVKEALSRAPYAELRATANAVLSVLRSRGLPIPREVETQICATQELPRLREWLRRAATVVKSEDLFT